MFLLLPLLVLLMFSCAPNAESVEIPIKYTLARKAQVSLLIKDSNGKVVRELLHGAPRAKGANTEMWDGRDEKGQPVPAGNYRWKLLSTQGLSAEYLLTIGSGSPDIKQPGVLWPGNHNGVWAVVQDESGLYFGGSGEGTPPLIKQSRGDRRLWAIPHWLEAWQGPVDLALAGGKVWMLHGNGNLWSADATTGQPEGKSGSILWDKNDANHTKNLGATQVLDMDARGNQMVASYANHNAVRWLNLANANVQDEATVPEPLGIALAPDKKVLVISQGKVVFLSRENKTPQTLITGLTSPWRLAVDQKRGDIFVAERGGGQQVKKFSKDGRLLATFGPKGGRQKQGLYNAKGFRDIVNITADDEGGFYVCEWHGAPRRTAHFTSDGRVAREWYGGQMYANFAVADPTDPTLVWLDSDWGELIQARVDYGKKTWAVRATYRFQDLADGLIDGTRHGGSRWFVRRRGSETYLLREGGIFQVLRVDEKNRRLIPLFVGDTNLGHDWNMKSEASPTLKRIVESKRGELGELQNVPMSWADANVDGHVQEDEIKFVDFRTLLAAHFGSGAGSAAKLVSAGATPSLKIPTWGSATRERELLNFLQWAASGAPQFVDVETKWDPQPADITDADNRADTMVWIDKEGNRFLARNTEGAKPFGQGFWGSRVGGNRLVKWNKNGKVEWEVGKHAPGTEARAGEAKYFWRVVGAPRGCIAVSDVEGGATLVWDQDGLWVGRFFDNINLQAAPREAYVLSSENFGGSLYENPTTGTVFFYGGGTNHNPVYRIDGWDQFERQTGTITVGSPVAGQIKQSGNAGIARPALARIPNRPEVKLDGDLSDWKGVAPLIITDGVKTVARVYLGWNNGQAGFGDDAIYAAFDVTTNRPWKTAATPQLAFQGGASVDMKIGPLTGETSPQGPLGIRAVAAPVGGKTTVFEFAQIRPTNIRIPDHGYDNWKAAPATYETGNGKVSFVRAAPLQWADVVWAAQKPKPDGTGYIVEMRVPISGIITTWPIAGKKGEKFRLDLGVTLANAQGTASRVRLNWHSKDPNDMATQDVYTEALLRPQNWGTAVLE